MTTIQHLAAYGGRIVKRDGRRIVQLRDPNDNARKVFEYRLALEGRTIERRILRSDGSRYPGVAALQSDWQRFEPHEMDALLASRGLWHPIIDPLLETRR